MTAMHLARSRNATATPAAITRRSARPGVRALCGIGALALAYWAAARLGLLLAFQGSNASPVWPPAGIGFAALALFGPRLLPGIAIGAFLANVQGFAAHGGMPLPTMLATSAAIACGNSAEAWLGTDALRRWTGGAPPFDRLADVFKFVAVALGSCLAAAAVGTSSLLIGGVVPATAGGTVALTWWTGDVVGVLIVAPLLMSRGAPPAEPFLRARRESAVLLACVSALAALVFVVPSLAFGADRRLAYLFIPCIALAAYRHGPRGVAATSFAVAAFAIWGTTHGSGPFAQGELNDALLVLQTFVGLCAVTGLVLTADRRERLWLGQDSAVRRDLFAPWAVLLVGLAVTVFGWHAFAVDAERQARASFDDLAQDMTARIDERMLAYEQVLRGAAGLFAASLSVERDEFHAYVDRLAVQDHYPGLLAIGYLPVTKAGDLEAHERWMRGEGFAGYAVRPPGVRDEYASVVYIEPFDEVNRRALGFDVLSERVRRDAVHAARDGGIPSLTAPIVLPQDQGLAPRERQQAVVLFIPIYRNGADLSTEAARRAAITGYVSGVFRAGDLIRGIFRGRDPALARLRLFDIGGAGDGASGTPVALHDDAAFAAAAPFAGASLFAAERSLDVSGRRWRLEYASAPTFEATIDRGKAQIVLVATVGASLLLFTLVRSLTLTRERAERLADDITFALRLSESSARRAQRQLSAVMDASPLGIFFTDDTGSFLYTNASWQRIVGQTNAMALGRGWEGGLHEDDRERVIEAWRRAVRSGEPFGSEHRFRRPDGRIVWTRLVAAAIGEREDSLGHVGLLEDVTEQHAKDAELAAKTAALERSNVDLEEFAYVASHDLQEPLRTVASYSQLLMRRHRAALPTEAREFLDYMGDGAQRAQRLVADLLSLARLESGRRPPTRIDMEALLADVRRQMDGTLRAADALLTHEALPVVVGDASQLTQLMQNLVGNAIKFRGERPPRVHVSASRDGSAWRFRVSDNGIGIDPAHHARIFTLFQRLHTRDSYAGTGIGLAICKKVVERHGGSIRVDSAPGRGAAFFFTLPDRPAEMANAVDQEDR